MIAKLTLLFTTVTLLELTLLIPLGQALGLPVTLAIVLGTAIFGASLAKRQGVAIWSRIQKELSQGGLPGDSLLDGLAVLIAGAFLLTPGVLTDVAGIMLLVPVTRKPVKALVKKYAKEKLDTSSVAYMHHNSAGTGTSTGTDTIDAGFPNGPDMGSRSTDYHAAGGEDDIIDVNPIETHEKNDDGDEETERETIEAVVDYQATD